MPLVPCSACKKDVNLTVEEIRRLVDEDRVATCDVCTVRRARVLAAGPARRLSKSDKMLAVLADLEAAGRPYVYWRKLAKIAWEADREAFGMKPYADEHPDSNLVMILLVNMRKKGLIEWVGENTGNCRLTAKGRGELAAAGTLCAVAKGA